MAVGYLKSMKSYYSFAETHRHLVDEKANRVLWNKSDQAAANKHVNEIEQFETRVTSESEEIGRLLTKDLRELTDGMY